jgi:alkanesulfonate monooxygenase SsuD/methylene tetrahydromethanopterin reductase-like flavin-dependent oxidoreductase (luciferase family)
VVCTSFRNPALLAKMADTVEEISGGRLILGLGAGWHEPEYRAFGHPFDHRVSRFEEALQIICPLLREGHVDFEGHFYRAWGCELRLRGPRPQGPPILIGTIGTRMLQIAARHADLWNAGLVGDPSWPDAVPPLRAMVDHACAAVSRDPATLRRTVNPLVHVARLGTAPVFPGAEPLAGSTDEIAAAFRGFAREGISHVQVLLNPNTLAGLEALAPVLELLDRDPRDNCSVN